MTEQQICRWITANTLLVLAFIVADKSAITAGFFTILGFVCAYKAYPKEVKV